MIKYSLVYLSLIILIAVGCTGANLLRENEGENKVSNFDEYWYQSKAEISTYKLEQARYGEIRNGHATMVFVTEPFNDKKQVKADNAMDNDVVNVLKLNQTRKFITGIYPYSTMTSTFTPVDISGPSATLKLTNSVQEWCGQEFVQLNKRMGDYQLNAFSYFESSGDISKRLDNNLLEDEIFSLIRINPKGLPTGEIKVFPSSVYLRFSHNEMKAYDAIVSLQDTTFNGKKTQAYHLEYPDLNRTFTVFYDSEFPFSIEGWVDTYKSFGGPKLSSTATKVNEKMIDYWNRNQTSDTTLYQELFDFRN